MPRNQHHPTPEEMDERVKVDVPPEKFIRGVMEAGEHPEEDDEEEAHEEPDRGWLGRRLKQP